MNNYLFLLCLVHYIHASPSTETNKIISANDQNEVANQILSNAFVDISKGIPITNLAIIFDNFTDTNMVKILCIKLNNESISSILFNVSIKANQNKFFDLLSQTLEAYEYLNCLFLCTKNMLEYLFEKIHEGRFIHRNILYILYWNYGSLSKNQIYWVHYKILFITNPRNGTFRLYFNNHVTKKYQAISMVNWWSVKGGLFRIPTLPSSEEIYKDFKGTTLQVPVIHKPPWYFVKRSNNSITVYGGRDKKLLSLLANKLNFRYAYFDPLTVEGHSFKNESAFENSINLIKFRKADLFLGDVTLTVERSRVVEFSFITLADSEAFITHTPGRLNEALALIQPFKYEVWPAILLILLLSGPFLFLIIIFKSTAKKCVTRTQLFFDCVWFTTTIFLKQSIKGPSDSIRPRIFAIILSIAITYVIGDMYSANLTSLLAKPGREKPIHNLHQLETAMVDQNYELFVENNSSPYFILQNGSGIYGKLWQLMKRQPSYVVTSVENGVKMVKKSKNVAVIAGRETLFFDIQRFGPSYFHLSEKLNTEYSAIAFQLGCPYIENVNKILMAIFEAGIMTKMTEDEYEKLGKQHLEINTQVMPENKDLDSFLLDSRSYRNIKIDEENEKLQPINIKMLSGAFYVILIGHTLAGIVLLLELLLFRKCMDYFSRSQIKPYQFNFSKFSNCFRNNIPQYEYLE